MHVRFILIVLLIVTGAFVGACEKTAELDAFTVETAVGPAGSLLVLGECALADGVQVLVHAVGGEAYGAHLETAVLTPVVAGRYYADVGVYDPLLYRVEVAVSPRYNRHVALPAAAPSFADPELRVREAKDDWEIYRQVSHRLGTPEQERQHLRYRLAALGEASDVLARFAGQLREIETTHKGLARWYRLYWDNRHKTRLAKPGIDTLYPALHNHLLKADEVLQRRFHAILAATTGETDESDRMDASWELLENRLVRVTRDLADLRQKLPD